MRIAKRPTCQVCGKRFTLSFPLPKCPQSLGSHTVIVTMQKREDKRGADDSRRYSPGRAGGMRWQ